RRRHTRFSRDWSSDVCSSDLEGEFRSVKRITNWAAKNGCLGKVEILGFVDGSTSLDWIESAGGKVLNLLTKGSLRHVTSQLRKRSEERRVGKECRARRAAER